MKTFKILFILAGLSSVVVASDVPNDSYMNQLYNVGSSAVKKTSELGSLVAKNASEFGATVSTKTFDFGTLVAKNASEFGTTLSKNTSEICSSVAATSSDLCNQAGLKASEMTIASTKFVEDNKQAVIISAAVASALALTAIVRYNIYGYVFYKSAVKVDETK